MLIGGDGPGVIDRVLAFGDGWLPMYRPHSRVVERMEELRARAERPIEVTVFMPADARELERVANAGARRVLHWLPSGGPSIVEPALERWEAAISELVGG